MPRTSTIRRLPEAVRELIGKLRDDGRTIDEIMAKLGELSVGVSRSAIGRHVKQLDAIAESIRHSRAMAEAVVRNLGDAPESKVARMNMELLHGALTKLVVGEEGASVELTAQDAMMLSTSVARLAQAAKSDVDREAAIRKQFVKKLEAQVTAATKAGEKGLSLDRIAELRREFLGVSS